MATHPKKEQEIITLARSMINGFTNNSDIFPSPPVNSTALQTSLDTFLEKSRETDAAEAVFLRKTEEKKEALENLNGDMKDDLRYAEQASDFDDTKLKTIGWGAPKAKTPLTAPGRVPDLSILEQGPGAIKLTWRKPTDGGKPSAYEIRRREVGATAPHALVEVSAAREIELTDQPRGTELEYVVRAMNRAGKGPFSNTVTATL